MMSVKDFLRSMEDYGPNGPMILRTKLKPIAILLHNGESRNRYEDAFLKWLKTRSVDLDSLKDNPEEERRYRQSFAYMRATTVDIRRDSNEHCSRSRHRSPSRSRKRSPSKASSRDLKRSRLESGEVVQAEKPNAGREWEKMAKRVEQLENNVSHRFSELERELKALRAQSQVTNGELLRGSQNQKKVELRKVMEVTPSTVVKSECESPGKADILNEGTEILKRATQTQPAPALKRLVKEYIRLNDQIEMNEAAVQDSLAYIKTLEGGADVDDRMMQINELKASMEWKHKWEEFERLAGQVDLTAISRSSYEQLAGEYIQLNRIVNGDGTETSPQLEEVKKLSKALSETISEWTDKERYRQELSVDVARRDDAVYTLAKELIAEAHLWLKKKQKRKFRWKTPKQSCSQDSHLKKLEERILRRSDSDIKKLPRRSRSRRELLETKVMFPDGFLQSMKLFGPNGSMHIGERLKPIAIVLRPNEPLHRYEENFQYRLDRRGTTLLKLQDDPDEERQTFAYFRATTAVQQHWDRGGDKHSNFDSKTQYRSRGDNDSARKPSTPAVSPSEPTQTFDAHPPDNILPTVEQYTCSNPIRMATELLQKAARVKSDPTRKRLAKDYTSLSSYVITNEADLRDSLARAEITACATRIKELAVRIDCKKRRRDAALAADQKSELEYLVRQVEPTEPLHASHEKLTHVLIDLHQNGAGIVALQVKLESCLQNAQSVSGTAFQELEIVSTSLPTVSQEVCTGKPSTAIVYGVDPVQ
ncbi:hypothetical protein P3T76_015797 [Phytophthora citrophthora]|uniref:Uncharacterized protein n=1 Tax=Phytophthora citrophthora TaxID=4793 RepID=A0AAD9FYQ3_9STRA|nr:hypothetical protein P3T76_015797 [Phytophthora citrophthora]